MSNIVYITQIEGNIADWAEGLAIESGSFYYYSNSLYKATESHTATATFDTAKFTRVSEETTITDWAESLSVVSGSYYFYSNSLYKATESHTATATFDTAKFVKLSEETKITDWAESLAVVEDEYYLYNDTLYKATTSHTATATFDTEKFTPVSTTPPSSLDVEDGTTNLTDTQTNVNVDTTNGDATVNLPTAVGKKDRSITVRKSDDSSNTVTIDGDTTETIDGETTKTLYYENQVITLVSDGTNWYTLNEVSGSNFARIVAGTTEPTDTTVYWLDTN